MDTLPKQARNFKSKAVAVARTWQNITRENTKQLLMSVGQRKNQVVSDYERFATKY